MRALAFCILWIPLLFLTSCSDSIKIDSGRLKGTFEEELTIYKGIPFAAPPVGDLRWRPPQPVKKWEGILKADRFAPACIQPQRDIPDFPKIDVSEDCLYLNIWTPAKSSSDKLPVMVWIHGGGFAIGSPSLSYNNGKQLSKRGVVVVNIAYRLGPLGFLAHPDLSAESENHVSGNYGLLDQLAGLKWVQRNIKAFGGDPENVTAFGESAGAASVSMLTASPLAKGLFHRAIGQSGGSFGPARVQREFDAMQLLEGAEASGVEFAKRMGANTLADLRALPPESWEKDPASRIGGFWPIIDSHVITDDQHKLYESGSYNDVPILIGSNSDEGSIFARPSPPEEYEKFTRFRFGPHAGKILEHYPGRTEDEVLRSSADIFRDAVFAWHVWTWAKLQSKTGKSNGFVYYFDQKHAPTPFPDPVPLSRGAPHGAEMPYMFGHLSENPSGTIAADDLALSETMAAYWINFAKTGDPNSKGLPEWPVFNAGEPTVMYFKTRPHTGPVPNRDKLKVLDEYFAWKRNSTPE